MVPSTPACSTMRENTTQNFIDTNALQVRKYVYMYMYVLQTCISICISKYIYKGVGINKCRGYFLAHEMLSRFTRGRSDAMTGSWTGPPRVKGLQWRAPIGIEGRTWAERDWINTNHGGYAASERREGTIQASKDVYLQANAGISSGQSHVWHVRSTAVEGYLAHKTIPPVGPYSSPMLRDLW